MTTATLTAAVTRRADAKLGDAPPPLPAAPSLGAAVLRASEMIGDLDLTDAAWDRVGPQLTAFVDAARRALGLDGSPIGPRDIVTPVLRLRDLAWLAARAASPAAASVAATPLVTSCLRSLQDEVRRCPSG